MKIIETIDRFNNSPKGKVIKSILMLAFSVALVVVVTLAWFASNVSTTASNMAVTMETENSIAYYSTYTLTDIDTGEITKTTPERVNGVTNLSIELRPYDTTFKSVNQFAPVVVRIEIYETEGSFIPTGEEVRNFSLILARDPSIDTGTTTALAGLFSSIGQIGCYVASELDLSSSNSDIYNTIIAKYRADASVNKFTTKSNGVYSKVNSLSIDVEYSAANVKHNNTTGKDCVIVYVVFDYNEQLTEEYTDQQESSGGAINITNDLTRLDIDI